MSFVVVIPARFASTRFPGKPLVKLKDKTMLEHVWLGAKKSQATEIVIATDHDEIFECAEAFGANVVMTSDEHVSGTDRIQEVASKMAWADDQIIVNVQGDEPFIAYQNIDQVAQLLTLHQDAGVATLFEPITTVEEFVNPNVVKGVVTHQRCLYFSRAAIPFDRDNQKSLNMNDLGAKRHVGIYAYKKSAIDAFVTWPQGLLEKIECLEQLRFMENAVSIVGDESSVASVAGIDTPEDLEWAKEYMADNL